jgi:hypothetical protein
METGKRMSLSEAFSVIPDTGAASTRHDVVEMLVVAVCAVLCVGRMDSLKSNCGGRERLEWLRRFMKLENGIASHDPFGRLFGLLDGKTVEASFRNGMWSFFSLGFALLTPTYAGWR